MTVACIRTYGLIDRCRHCEPIVHTGHKKLLGHYFSLL